MIETFHWRAGEAENKMRLDEFLFDRIGAVSKMYLRNIVLEGKCRVNGETGRAGQRLRAMDSIEIEVDSSAVTSMKPEHISLDILFEDQEIIVVDKPAEMLVHPTRNVKSGTLLNALSYHLNREEIVMRGNADSAEEISPQINTDKHRFENNFASENQSEIRNQKSKFIRPGLIHRLDKKTSGLMLIAKTARAHRILSGHFQRKLVEKKYFAVVEGTIEENFGAINAPIGYDEAQKKWIVSEAGKTAETRFQVLERRADTALLELEPVTGRTNQLRIHCEFLGHPIVGDANRGGREFPRLCLHAAKLSFRHPAHNERMIFETAIPKDFPVN